MVKAVWIFDVPVEKQDEYLRMTMEIIKPYWEAHECKAYQVYQDYDEPTRFIKEQIYPDKETMERSMSLAGTDPDAKKVIQLFGEYAQNIQRRRCTPRVDIDGYHDFEK